MLFKLSKYKIIKVLKFIHAKLHIGLILIFPGALLIENPIFFSQVVEPGGNRHHQQHNHQRHHSARH